MKNLIVLFFICIGITFLGTKTYLLLSNTLKNNQNWTISKLQLEMQVMGAENFFEETQPLNHDQLNLGSWHGFQEIVSINDYQFDQLNFRLKFDPDAYLYIFYQFAEDSKLALKISSLPNQTGCVQVRQDGYFQKSSFSNIPAMQPNQWIKISLNKTATEALFKIGDQEISCPINGDSSSKIGFKNGMENTLIDDIELKNQGKKIFYENFSNQNKFQYYFSLTLFWLILINLFGLVSKNHEDRKKQLLLQILINLSALLIFITAYNYLLFFYVGNYPNLNSSLIDLKKEERNWAKEEVKSMSKSIMDQGQVDNAQNILFIGSSQTAGAGASSYQLRFTNLVENELKKELSATTGAATAFANYFNLSTDKPVNFINAGAAGTTSTELLEEYSGNWINLKPKVVFINLSSNDYDYGIDSNVFKQNLEKFIEINNKNTVKTILLLEARTPENKNLNQFHSIVIEVAKSQSIPLIDIYSHLKDNDSKGIIWWDFVHPTDYGHFLIAERVIDELKSLILKNQTINIENNQGSASASINIK